jgi:hypothetical protein
MHDREVRASAKRSHVRIKSKAECPPIHRGEDGVMFWPASGNGEAHSDERCVYASHRQERHIADIDATQSASIEIERAAVCFALDKVVGFELGFNDCAQFPWEVVDHSLEQATFYAGQANSAPEQT